MGFRHISILFGVLFLQEKLAKFKKYNAHSAHVTNVRWSHDDSCLVTVGGADLAMIVWNNLDERAQQAALPGVESDGDTDSEEESGYDSDVEREKKIDYSSKTYSSSLRETSGTKPQHQNVEESRKPAISRASSSRHRVQRKEAVTAEGKKKKPSDVQELSLDFVHGYRGFDSRNNLHYLPEGDIVYHAAGAGIVYNTTANKQSFYLEHTDDIICLAVNQNPKFKNVVATGQIGTSPTVHVWNAASLDTLSIIQGFHTKGVCYVNFSSSGRYLLSIGLDDEHSVAVWRWAEGSKVATAVGHSQRIFVAEFRPDSDTSFVTCGVKHVMFWTVAGGSLVGKKGILSLPDQDVKLQTMLSVAFGANDTTFTGSMSGDVFVWAGSSLARVVSQAHAGPIFTMYTTLKDGLIVTGGKEKEPASKENRSVKIWDQEMKKCRMFQLSSGSEQPVPRSVCRGGPKGTLLVGTQDSKIIEINEKSTTPQVIMHGHSEGDIWGLAAHPEEDLFVTGSDDSTVRVWSVSSKTVVKKASLAGPVRSVAYSPNGDKIAVGMKNGEFAILNSKSLQILGKKRDRHQAIHDLRFSPEGDILAVGSDDNTLDFYDSREGGTLARIGYCKGIPSFVIQMDFSADGKYIQVSTGAYERLVFSVPGGQHITAQDSIESITWSTWTSMLGKEVIGIWPKNADKGDINCTDLSHHGSTLATGDDFGYVKLYKFPCLEKFTKGKKFVGHSAHVTKVRFSHDDKYLFSTGGDDCCVFVWRCA